MSDGPDGMGMGDVLGDFRILGKLGEGGMGVVYLAQDERLERRIALKVIAPLLARDGDFRKRFIAEARSAAAIEHPNVVTIYSSGTVDGNLYIAMRYVEGTDLRAALREPDTLDVSASVRIVSEVAAALDAAHAAGMVHRDVKPGNVLLEGELGVGASYLTDFGLTKGGSESGAQLTGTGQWVGTIDYVAPEQIQGGKIDARTDVYALGCVLYEALTGTVPFAGNEMQKMWGHVNEPFPSLRAKTPGHAAELAAVVERATAKDPRDRFPSAGDLAHAATAAATGRGIDSPERSVAVGPAAEGLLESATTAALPASAGPARTATGRAPVPPRETPTTQMPSPPPPPRRPTQGGGSSSHRTATVIGAAAVIAAGLLAAAIVIAGDGSSGEATAPSAGQQGRTSVAGQGNPASTAPPSGAQLGDWTGGSGYSAMLGAFSSEAGARVWQRQAVARGVEAGVLYSSNFSSLRPGYWVVFSGSFDSVDQAAARANLAKSLGYSDAYPKLVAP